MPQRKLSTRGFAEREVYGEQRLPVEVPYSKERRDLLWGQLRAQRKRVEGSAIWWALADERAAQARSRAMGRMTRRPEGEERSTRGIVLEKDEGHGLGMMVGWVDTKYRRTKTITTKDQYERVKRRTEHGGVEYASIVLGRAHQDRRPGDVSIFVAGHGLMWVTTEEVASTADKAVKRAFAGTSLTDGAYAGAKRMLDRVEGGLAMITEAMRDSGLNPEIAQYMGSSVGRNAVEAAREVA